MDPSQQTKRIRDTAITISWAGARGAQQDRRTTAFCIGHDAAGNISTDDQQVTQALAAVFLRDGQWWARDIGGVAGLTLNGAPFQSAPLPRRAVMALGTSGAQVMLEVEVAASPAPRPMPVAPQSTHSVGAGAGVGAGATGVVAGVGAGVGGSGAGAHTVLAGAMRRDNPSPTAATAALPINVQVEGEPAPRQYNETIRAGRGEGCAIRINHGGVSRNHVELFRVGNQWCARDLTSGNGTFLNGERIDEAVMPGRCTLQLGADGPTLELSYAAPAGVRADAPRSMEEVAAHYFDPKSGAPAGTHTMMVRRAFTQVQKQQTRRYGTLIAGALALLLVAVGVGVYQHYQLQKTRTLAEQLFYNMKTVELQLARLEEQVQATAGDANRADVAKGRAQLAQMATQYNGLLEELGVLDKNLPPEERLILNIAREFGECELGMPREFVTEVKRYIGIWHSNQRLAQALQRASDQGVAPVIVDVMRQHHLPPQFFFVALQESDFRHEAIGPTTRFGIAKGMWQMMPETAMQYGLRMGPLSASPEFDLEDERFDPAAATNAAAKYLGDLYRGEAQASGLLVLASYNWGTTRVRKRILAMKENPRDRNFWKLLGQTEIPKETRDYVFMIFAAAVISEDPKLFGFKFAPPLLDLKAT